VAAWSITPNRFGGGRPPAPARRCLDGIFFVLRTGGQWKALNVTGVNPVCGVVLPRGSPHPGSCGGAPSRRPSFRISLSSYRFALAFLRRLWFGN